MLAIAASFLAFSTQLNSFRISKKSLAFVEFRVLEFIILELVDFGALVLGPGAIDFSDFLDF